MMSSANRWEKARWQAAAAPHAGSWMDAAPSIAFDTLLTNSEVKYGICRRLGVEVGADGPCPFCLGVMDRFGAHGESCVGGGDKTVVHHCVRNVLHSQAKRSGFGSVLEAAGVLNLLGVRAAARAQGSQERPADVLLVQAQDVRTGVGRRSGRIALDVGIVCPQAASHLDVASAERLGAAEVYVRRKCGRADMERRCAQAGVVFQPVIFESLGGVSAEAEGVLKCVNKAVAVNTDSREGEVATQFWHRVGVDLLRGMHRASMRRFGARGVDDVGGGRSAFWGAGLLQVPAGV